MFVIVLLLLLLLTIWPLWLLHYMVAARCGWGLAKNVARRLLRDVTITWQAGVSASPRHYYVTANLPIFRPNPARCDCCSWSNGEETLLPLQFLFRSAMSSLNTFVRLPAPKISPGSCQALILNIAINSMMSSFIRWWRIQRQRQLQRQRQWQRHEKFQEESVKFHENI